MKKTHTLLGIIILLALIWIGYNLSVTSTGKNPQPTPSPLTTDTKKTSYTSDTYNISFNYSTDFFLTEKEVGTPLAPQYSITLAEDTQENRDLFSGKITDAREGPPTITIDIYPNENEHSPQQWLENNTTWTAIKNETTPTSVNGHPAITFTWSGLYEGKSTIISANKHTYVISTAWLDETSKTINEYQEIIKSLNI